MGMFEVLVGVENPGGGERTEVSVLVDSGTLHTMLPSSLLEHLDVHPVVERDFEATDGVMMRLGVGEVKIFYGAEGWTCPVIFGREDEYLMGATTLEIFNLMVDPVNETLIPVRRHIRPI